MKSHGSAEELFKHYEAVHNSGIDSTLKYLNVHIPF
uniref:Uncharacterized protein n=1 Tax=Pavo cristatus TaxID=9049 RepID=A0A8C9FWH1_PAVCR